ncbi:MAG: heme-binding domain-containing protein [Ferruginibacter sp.]
MKRFFKLFFGIILFILILFQFYPRANNNLTLGISLNDITLHHNVPVPVQQILATSCYDCHSNNTIYPWYANIQPVSLWLGNHIKEGKSELNFSEFGTYNLRRQYRKLEEINDQVKREEMPLSSYTLIHRDAKLSADQKLVIATWVTALRDSFKANYPLDSLQKKK